LALGDLDADGANDLIAATDGIEILFQSETKPGNFEPPVRVH
jgi:hypothetical protein